MAAVPEGHTILRASRRIAAALGNDEIVRVVARGPALIEARAEEKLRGARLVEASPHGKVLLLHFDNGLSVHSHLRMDGSWHVYRTGEPWRKGFRAAWLVLETAAWQVVNFNGPVLELAHTTDALADMRVTRLGPDILAVEFDDAEYLRRMRANAEREIGDAVMQQAIVAGIGNIYKSESLFMTQTSPWARVGELGDEQLARIRETASRIMLDGVLDARAITFRGPGPAGRWAYDRTGRPCRRCGAKIISREQGADRRVTWWCPRCQPD